MKLCLLLALTATLFAAPKDKQKLTCTAKELARFDCRLYSGTYNIRLLPKTIAWNDGTWHTVDEMPLKGEAVGWEKVSFGFMGGWPVLQLWLWDKGAGETDVQALHWYVADAEKRKFTVLADGVVRRRRPEPAGEVDPKAKKPPKTKYLFDAWETSSLKLLKNGSLEWRLNSQEKVISKTVAK